MPQCFVLVIVRTVVCTCFAKRIPKLDVVYLEHLSYWQWCRLLSWILIDENFIIHNDILHGKIHYQEECMFRGTTHQVQTTNAHPQHCVPENPSHIMF